MPAENRRQSISIGDYFVETIWMDRKACRREWKRRGRPRCDHASRYNHATELAYRGGKDGGRLDVVKAWCNLCGAWLAHPSKVANRV